MKKLFISLLLILTDVLFAQTATAPSGNGTSGTPYLIANLNNLYWITQNSPEWAAGKVYKQTADIDAAGTSSWDSNQGFSPIGNGTTAFAGTYDGQGYSISNLYISRALPGSSGFIGLFGYTNTASISNLRLLSVNMTGSISTGGLSVGALVGYDAGSTITQCSSSGSLTTSYNYTSIGGLIGYLQSTTLTKCYSTATINSTDVNAGAAVGGLIGQMNNAASVTECYSNGSANVPNGSSAYVGGLIGVVKGTVNGSFYCNITNSYSRSTVSGTYSAGGFIGLLESNTTITNCYSTGLVTGNASYIKGFIFSCTGTVSNSFWDTETSACPTSSDGTGKTTAEMKTSSTFLTASWSGTIWNIGDGINNGYPYLKWQNSGGTPLPVELNSFTANVTGSSVSLNWQTATEVNNYGFNVERTSASLSASWESLDFVQGHGNSNSPKDYSFVDANPPCGVVQYRLKQIDFDGKFEYSDIVQVNVDAPAKIELRQNHPNPFNPETTISFKIQVASYVTLKVHDILGREVATLVDEIKQPGVYNSQFSIRNSPNGSLRDQFPSGVYFYTLRAGNYISTKKMILMK